MRGQDVTKPVGRDTDYTRLQQDRCLGRIPLLAPTRPANPSRERRERLAKVGSRLVFSVTRLDSP